MENQIKELTNLLNNSKSVLILTPSIITTDIMSSCLSAYYMISTLMKKETMIGSTAEIPLRFKTLLNEFGVEDRFILRELKPLQYVFTLPDIEKNMGIDLKRENGKVSLYVTPSKAELNKAMVSFSVVGEKFDLILVIGAKSLDSISSFYHKDIFATLNTVNIDVKKYNTQFCKINIVDGKASSVSEVLFNVYKDLGIKIEEKVADLLLKGLLSGSRVFKNINSNSIFKNLSEIASFSKYDEVINDYLYSLSTQGLKLRAKMFENLQLDPENKIIWSKLSEGVFKQLEINPLNIAGIDYLPFDAAEGFDKSILIYETKLGQSVASIFGYDGKIETQKAEVHQNGDVTELKGNLSCNEMESLIKDILGITEPIKNAEAKEEIVVKDLPKPRPEPLPTAPGTMQPLNPFVKVQEQHAAQPEPRFGPQAPFKKADLS